MCSKCGETKPLDAFYKKVTSPDGHRADCKSCRSKVALAYYLAHHEETKASSRAYYAEHSEEQRAKQREWRDANKEKIRAYHRKYNAAHQAKNKAYCRARYALKAEERRAYRKAWCKDNPDQIRVSNNKRKALQRNAPQCDLTTKQWQAIKEAYGHRCVYCGRKLKRLTMDHAVPLSKGGAHTATNIVPACMSCNNHKKAGPAPPFQQALLAIPSED